jgi:hypothetical protein
MAGKGSRPRPLSVDRKTYESNWDRIFNKNRTNQSMKEEYNQREKTFDQLDNLAQQIGDVDPFKKNI